MNKLKKKVFPWRELLCAKAIVLNNSHVSDSSWNTSKAHFFEFSTFAYDVCGVMTDRSFLLQVAAMGLPGRPLHLLALPPLLPPVKGDHPRCRVLLPGGHHPGLHLPRPRGGPHHDQQQQQPAQFPDRQPEAAAWVAEQSWRPRRSWNA